MYSVFMSWCQHFKPQPYLGQGGEALLFHVPHQLISRELQALLHFEFGYVNSHQQVALLQGRYRGAPRVLLHLQHGQIITIRVVRATPEKIQICT